jgi:hypothetical protein
VSDNPDYTIERLRDRFGTFSWQGQALQYDQLGPSGEIVYRRYVEDNPRSTVEQGTLIDTLLFYDEQGVLAGILNHYPYGAIEKNGNELEKPHSANTFARPGTDEDAINAALVAEAKRRWPTVRGEDIFVGPVPRPQLPGYIDDAQHRIRGWAHLK